MKDERSQAPHNDAFIFHASVASVHPSFTIYAALIAASR
jgi:hypothetical protein